MGSRRWPREHPSTAVVPRSVSALMPGSFACPEEEQEVEQTVGEPSEKESEVALPQEPTMAMLDSIFVEVGVELLLVGWAAAMTAATTAHRLVFVIRKRNSGVLDTDMSGALAREESPMTRRAAGRVGIQQGSLRGTFWWVRWTERFISFGRLCLPRPETRRTPISIEHQNGGRRYVLTFCCCCVVVVTYRVSRILPCLVACRKSLYANDDIDLQESAVRRTKRQRTRDAACQTLTYRQLRDGENTVVPKRNHPVRCKHANNTAQPTPEEPQKARARQGHEHQETRFHVVPASRFVSMLNPPSCSMSSTTTLSTASVYRVTDGGGVVHGAIVRGGTRSTDVEERRRVPRQRQDRVAGRGGGNGDVNDNVVRAKHLESRLTHALGVPASTRRQQGRRVDGPKFNLSADDEAGTGLFASLANGEGMVICTPALSSQQHNIPLQDHHQLPQQGLSAPAQSPIQQPGAIGDRSMSPTLGQVAISWGREAGNETAGKMQGNEPSMGGDSAAAVPSFSRGGRGPRPLRSDRDTLEAGCYDMSSNGGAGQDGGTGSEGFAYESLSKGPDYRKVIRVLSRSTSMHRHA